MSWLAVHALIAISPIFHFSNVAHKHCNSPLCVRLSVWLFSVAVAIVNVIVAAATAVVVIVIVVKWLLHLQCCYKIENVPTFSSFAFIFWLLSILLPNDEMNSLQFYFIAYLVYFMIYQ